MGRKRHGAVDTDERLLMVNLTTADVSDNAGAQLILDGIRKRWPWLNPKSAFFGTCFRVPDEARVWWRAYGRFAAMPRR